MGAEGTINASAMATRTGAQAQPLPTFCPLFATQTSDSDRLFTDFDIQSERLEGGGDFRKGKDVAGKLLALLDRPRAEAWGARHLERSSTTSPVVFQPFRASSVQYGVSRPMSLCETKPSFPPVLS